MKVTLTATTGARVLVWRQDDNFYARIADQAVEPQVCLAIDLFEVIAELAGLDLEQPAQAAVAVRLADEAQRRLRSSGDDRRRSAEACGPS